MHVLAIVHTSGPNAAIKSFAAGRSPAAIRRSLGASWLGELLIPVSTLTADLQPFPLNTARWAFRRYVSNSKVAKATSAFFSPQFAHFLAACPTHHPPTPLAAKGILLRLRTDGCPVCRRIFCGGCSVSIFARPDPRRDVSRQG